VLNLGIPFTPIAYVYNSNNPNDVTLLDESGKTYSIVTVDGRQMLQDNSTKVYLKQFTTEQVDNLRKEQQEYVKTAQQKETQPKDIETTPKQATQNAGGGGESGFAGEEKPKGSNAFEDILRLEYQISQERDRPISIVGPSGSERLSDTGQYLGATAPVSSGQPLAKGIDTGGSLAGDIFTQGFGTTEFGTGTGKTGVGEESGKGKGTGGGKGTGEGTGEGSGTGEGTGGLSSLYVSGVGRGASGTGIGTGAGGVLYPSVGTAALAQALNIVPNLGGGGGDVDPSRSLNKKQPVWNVESLKLKDALGA
jgi:hypothetical protein